MSVVLNKYTFPDPLGVNHMNAKLRTLVCEARRKGCEYPDEIAGYVKTHSGYNITVLNDFARVYL